MPPTAALRSRALSVSPPVADRGCTDFKKSIGLEPTLPDEFAVESRAPLTLLPDELRPPPPGRRGQEKASTSRPSRRSSRPDPASRANRRRISARAARGWAPDIGRRSAQAPDPSAAVGVSPSNSPRLRWRERRVGEARNHAAKERLLRRADPPSGNASPSASRPLPSRACGRLGWCPYPWSALVF